MAPIGSHWVALPAVELNALCRKTPRHITDCFMDSSRHHGNILLAPNPPFSEDPDDPEYLNHIFFDWMLKQKCGQICTFCSCQTSPSPPLSFQNVPQHNLEASHLHLLALFANNICFSFFMCASTSASAGSLQQCCGSKVLP